MGFLSPWFLAGMAAVGLPLWLHLLRQYKRTPQPFSSLMFFERRQQSSVKHRRLRYFALLSLRMAMLVLLAVAFASPFITRTSDVSGRRKLTVIAIDRSFSMRYGDRMQQAKAEAHRILNGLHGRDFAQVVAFDAHVESLTRPEPARDVLSAAIDAVQPTDLASSFGEFTRALRVMDQSSGMALDVHLISDMQQTSLPSAFRDLEIAPHTALTLHSVGRANAPNWAVESVTAPAHVYSTGHTRLIATVAGWHTPAAQKTISVLLDGKPIAARDVTLPANGRAQAEFVGLDVPYGEHRGEVRIKPHDELSNDDSFFFSLERSDPRKVLFLYAGGRAQPAFYYKTAMDSASDTGLVVQTEAVELAGRDDLSKFAYVVLSDVGDPGDALTRALSDYVRAGGSVFIALGENTRKSGRLPLLGDRFSTNFGKQGAGSVDTQHPALDGAHFDNVEFSDAAQLAEKTGARVIAKLADGSPLLVEERVGEGRVLIFTSTLDNSGNDFPLHASFVPFVAQTGRYLAGVEEGSSNIAAGTPIALRRTRAEASAADVIGPDGKRELSLSDASKTLTFEPTRAGFYEIQRADGQRLLIAVHTDRRESDLTTVPAETLVLWRNTGNTATQAEPASNARQTQPWNLWRWALLLVLAAALVESVFASRYLEAERRTA
jgi:Aerotolerance regulator N-terminal/von Willebrand factor type A domain